MAAASATRCTALEPRSVDIDDSRSHMGLTDSCNQFMESIGKSWSKATTDDCKALVAQDILTDFLGLCQTFYNREEEQGCASERDLESIDLLFQKLQRLGVYKHLKYQNETGLFKRHPHLQDLQKRSKNNRNGKHDTLRQDAIRNEFWTLRSADSTSLSRAQTNNHVKHLDSLMQNKGLNWVLQLSNLARKVNIAAAERAICFVIYNENTTLQKVNTEVLEDANNLVYNTLLARSWDISSHKSIKFELLLQERNSAAILEDITDYSDYYKLDDSWRIVDSSAMHIAAHRPTPKKRKALKQDPKSKSKPKRKSKKQQLSKLQDFSVEITPVATAKLPGPSPWPAIDTDVAGEEQAIEPADEANSIMPQYCDNPSTDSSSRDEETSLENENDDLSTNPECEEGEIDEHGLEIQATMTKPEQVSTNSASSPVEANITPAKSILPEAEIDNAESPQTETENLSQDLSQAKLEIAAELELNEGDDELGQEGGSDANVPSTPSSPSLVVRSSSNEPALTAASLVGSPVAAAPQKRYLSVRNLRFPIKRDLHGLRDAINSIPSMEEDKFAQCALDLFFDSYFDVPEPMGLFSTD